MNRKAVLGAGRSMGHAADAGEREPVHAHLEGGIGGRPGRPAGIGVVAGQAKCRRPVDDAVFCRFLQRMAQVADLSAVGVAGRSIVA